MRILCFNFDKFRAENLELIYLRMNVSVEVQDNVIVRYFQGEIRLEDVIESWNMLFSDYTNLSEFQGVVSVFLEAELIHEDGNMNILTEYLSRYLDQLKDLKIAMVMDTPMVTNTIILGQKMKHLQIKPFSTEKAALEWVRI